MQSARMQVAFIVAWALALSGCGRQPPPVAVAPSDWAQPPGDAPFTDGAPFRAVNGPLVQNPPTHEPQEVSLADAEEIVGVVVEGEARAYSLTAMAQLRHHVVNDVIAETPVTVTYCNQKQCVRVYRGGRKAKSLRLRVGGYRDGLLLRDENGLYEQADGSGVASECGLPHEQLPYKRTTWRVWREAHPRSKVFAGE